jgi:hypothetical protein
MCDQWGWSTPHAYIAVSDRAIVFYYFSMVEDSYRRTQILFYFAKNNANRFLSYSPELGDMEDLNPKVLLAWTAADKRYYEELTNLQAKLREQLNETK